MGSLMLLDAASLYYRAFYGVPETITAPDGTPVNAVRGLLDMITRLVRGRSPGRVVACWDTDWRPAFRVEAHSHLQGAPGGGGRGHRADSARAGRPGAGDRARCSPRPGSPSRARPGTRRTT